MSTKTKKQKIKKVLCIIALILIAIAVFIGGYYALHSLFSKRNPHILSLTNNAMSDSLNSIKRVDEDGRLYFMEYTGKLNQSIPKAIMKLMAKSSCTAFATTNESGDQILCRNFDYPHFNNSGELTGVAAVIEYHPEGGYRSINGVDVTILNESGVFSYDAGMLDDGKTDTSLMALLPWLCVDGMNEKGLCASVLFLDVKEGESPTYQRVKGRESGSITGLMRCILDSCADTNEAIEFAKNYNLTNITGNDFHLLLTDANGNSVLLEWRNQKMQVISTDIATNFYQCSDDATDCYHGKELKEKWCGPANTSKTYRYGYGHGYARFTTIAEGLDGKTSITEQEAWSLLKQTEQTYVSEINSQTIYGIIYNCTQKSATIRMYGSTQYYQFDLD